MPLVLLFVMSGERYAGLVGVIVPLVLLFVVSGERYAGLVGVIVLLFVALQRWG